jgi:O-antigen ligase
LLPTNHATALRSIAEGGTVLLALIVAWRAGRDGPGRPPLPGRAIVIALLAWTGWSAASWLWSVNRPYTLSQLEREVFDMLLAAAALYVAPVDARAFRALVIAILASFAALALLAIGAAQLPGGWDPSRLHHGVGPWSTYAVIVAPLLLPLLAAAPSGLRAGPRSPIAAIVLLGLLVATARLTDNRMIWPALAATFATAAIAAALRWPQGFRRTRWRWLAPLAAVLMMLGIAFIDAAEEKAERAFPPNTSVARTLEADPRLALWDRVRDKVADRPWTGYGFGRRILAEPLVTELRNPLLTHAHNLFASQALQTGIPGFLAFSALLVAMADRFRRFLRSRDDALALVGVIGLSLIAGFVVKNMTDDFLFRSNAREFWGLCAVLLGYGVRRERLAQPIATGAATRRREAERTLA